MNGFGLSREEQTLHLPASAQRLLALLALHVGPMRRASAAGRIWGEAAEERAGANLRSALWRIRFADPTLVQSSPAELELGNQVWVDVRRLTATAYRLLDGARVRSGEELRSLIEARELLPGWSEEWVMTERERIGQLRLHALERLCEELIEARQFGDAVDAGLAAVSGEPLRESSHRVLIKAYLAEGNRAEALRQFGRYRDLIRSELGLEPAEDVQELVRHIGAGTG